MLLFHDWSMRIYNLNCPVMFSHQSLERGVTVLSSNVGLMFWVLTLFTQVKLHYPSDQQVLFPFLLIQIGDSKQHDALYKKTS